MFSCCCHNKASVATGRAVVTLLLFVCLLKTSSAFVVVVRTTSGTHVQSKLQLSSDVATPPTIKSKQASYGETEELPNSYVRCGKCQTAFAIKEDDLGNTGAGCRLECSVCGHSWFQTKSKLMTLENDFILAPLPERDLIRIQRNIVEGKSPKFLGDKKLYVGNISFECSEDDLFQLFGTCGDVGDVSVVRDDNGRMRGFGFVTMRTEADGLKAVAELDGKEIRGRNLAVRESTN